MLIWGAGHLGSLSRFPRKQSCDLGRVDLSFLFCKQGGRRGDWLPSPEPSVALTLHLWRSWRQSPLAVRAVLFGRRHAGSSVCSLFVPRGKSLWLMSNRFRGRGGGCGGCG